MTTVKLVRFAIQMDTRDFKGFELQWVHVIRDQTELSFGFDTKFWSGTKLAWFVIKSNSHDFETKIYEQNRELAILWLKCTQHDF